MFEEKLHEIGFNKNESIVYLELLKIGPQAASIIAKRVGFKRTTAYCSLRSLEKKGIVSSYKNNGVKFFVASDPNCLIGYLDRKCRTFDYHRSELLSVIPKFRSMADVYNFKKPVVSYFEGVEGVEQVMHDSLTTKGDFYAYMSPYRWSTSAMHDFLLSCKDYRIVNRKLPLKVIVPDIPEVREFFKQYLNDVDDAVEVLYTMADDAVFENEMNIYDEKVTILHLDRGDEYGVVIESKEIAAMHRSMFGMVWKWLKGRSKEKGIEN